MAQNIVIAIPTATRLQTFMSLPSLHAVVALIILLALARPSTVGLNKRLIPTRIISVIL